MGPWAELCKWAYTGIWGWPHSHQLPGHNHDPLFSLDPCCPSFPKPLWNVFRFWNITSFPPRGPLCRLFPLPKTLFSCVFCISSSFSSFQLRLSLAGRSICDILTPPPLILVYCSPVGCKTSAQKGPRLGLMLCYSCLKFLMFFTRGPAFSLFHWVPQIM